MGATGDRQFIDQLVPLPAKSDGNIPMAYAYLNCGQQGLRDAAGKWNRRHGFKVVSESGPYKSAVRWGAY